MVTDQEPRYRLVDADGNVVGSLFAESDGTLKLQEGTSGNDNELGLQGQSMDLAGNWGTAEKFVASLPLTGVDQSQPIAAENGNVTGPLSEITLFNPNGNNISAKAKVFGR